MTPDMGLGGYVTNNVSELYALCRAIRAIPAGSDCHIYSDSFVTLQRVFQRAKLNNVPPWLIEFMDGAILYLGDCRRYQWTLLDGHPTKDQLVRGTGKRGSPVSEWNVHCDAACTIEAVRYVNLLTVTP